MSHYQLKGINSQGQEVVSESLELTGNKSFKVFPVEKNETRLPLKGSAVVNIMGKEYSISLNHSIREYEDPEPSTKKWSYIDDVRDNTGEEIHGDEGKTIIIGYKQFTSGERFYSPTPGYGLSITHTYDTQQALNNLGDIQEYDRADSIGELELFNICKFKMYYKPFTYDGDDNPIAPTDDGTPASNKARIPCKPSITSTPDWLTDVSLKYRIKTTVSGEETNTYYDGWDEFLSAYNAAIVNPEYDDVKFYYHMMGKANFNQTNKLRGPYLITLQEVAGTDGIIHGAVPIYLSLSQEAGILSIKPALIPANVTMLNNQGWWSFDQPTFQNLIDNSLHDYDIYTDEKGRIFYNFKISLNLDQNHKAILLDELTGSTMAPDYTNPFFKYQYTGLPFILKLFKQTTLNIEDLNIKPYYKQLDDRPIDESGPSYTDFWRDGNNILGSQTFNPLAYSGIGNYAVPRRVGKVYPRVYFRGIDDIVNNKPLRIGIQLIPLTWYGWQYPNRVQYGFPVLNPDIQVEDYAARYNSHQSAIGSGDRAASVFLSWPNPDGSEIPYHIDPSIKTQSVPSRVGKNWEEETQYDSTIKLLNSILFLPVVWSNICLEDNPEIINYLKGSNIQFFENRYFFSPSISDDELDKDKSILSGIRIKGFNIIIRS